MTTTTKMRGIITAIAIILAGVAQMSAIEGLQISLQCSNVVLSWPSQFSETYIVQYRPDLVSTNPWITLTNYMPPDDGTNVTIFVHSNVVKYARCASAGSSSAAMFSSGESSEPIWASEPLAMRADGSGGVVPATIFPPGFEFSNYLLYNPSTGEWESGVGIVRAWPSSASGALSGANSSDFDPEGDGPPPPGPGDPPLPPETGFYRVVRNGVHIFGLTNETVLSGVVPLHVEAGYLEGSPLETVTLSANGSPIDGMFPVGQPLTAGITFNLDTRRLDNGSYYLQVAGRWRVTQTATYEPPTVQIFGVNGDYTFVYVTNDICYPNWITDVGETNMLFKITCLPTNINWQVGVYGDAGDFIRSFTNHSDDGLIDFAWDLRDTNGSARSDFTFTSITTFRDLDSNRTAASTNPPAVRRVDNYPDEGRWIVARADIIPHDFLRFGNFTNAINVIADMGEQDGGVRPISGRNFGEAYVVEVANITNWATIFHAFTNQVRNFYWFGHGTPDTIEDGERSIESSSVAQILHNDAPGTNNTRYRFVWLDGCSTAIGSWPAAFGLGTRENVPRNSYTTRPGAFAGYTQMVYGYGGHTTVSQAACDYRSSFAFYWSLANNGVKSAFDNAQHDSGFPEAQYLKLYGYWDMHWTDFNHKQDWPP